MILGTNPVGAVYDRAFFRNQRNTRGHRPRLQSERGLQAVGSRLVRTILYTGLLATALVATEASVTAEPQQKASADVNRRGVDGSTPLQWAVYDGNVAEVRRLLKAGANVSLANNYGATPMGLAAEVGNAEIIKLLLEAGADADSPNPEGQTALLAVARTGNVEAAELLVKHGAKVDARERWGGQTALMWASARRHPQMMQFLISKGADVNARSIDRDYQRHDIRARHHTVDCVRAARSVRRRIWAAAHRRVPTESIRDI